MNILITSVKILDIAAFSIIVGYAVITAVRWVARRRHTKKGT